MEFTKSNCRICLKSDAPLYVSVEDQLLDENIVDLIQEISRKRILIAEGLSKLICMACCKNLAAAIRTKRLFLRNDEALMYCFQYGHTKIQTNDDDPFLAEFDLEFENPDPDDGEASDMPLLELKTEQQDYDDNDLKMEVEALDEDLGKAESEEEDESETLPKISLQISKLLDNSCAETDVSVADTEKVNPSMVDEEEKMVEPPPRPKRPVKQAKPLKVDPQIGVKVRKETIDKISVLEIKSEELKLTCCMCKFTVNSEQELIAHLHSHPERARRSAFQKKIKEAAPDQKKVAGKLCIKCLRRVPDLQYHLKYFYVTQKFQCSQCGACYGFYNQMKQHELKCIRSAKVKAGLIEQEKFECHICAKQLKTKAILESHIRLHLMTAEDRTKFKCHICDRGYPSMRSLRCHVLLHTDVSIYQCTMCEKAFKKRNNLQAHIRVHNNSRIFKCTFCDKSYIHSIDRKRHEMAVHTGERPFKCQLCNDGFIKRYSLNLHMKKVHLIDTNTVDLLVVEEDGDMKVD